MSTYRDLYEAFSKCYASELRKQCIQDKCNAYWKELKGNFSGIELNAAVDKNISELRAETKSKKTKLLDFFTQASTFPKRSSSDEPSFTSTKCAVESSGTGTSSQAPDDFEGIPENVEIPKNPPPENILKRKYTTPAQDSARLKINILQDRLSTSLLARDVQLDLDIENDLKKTRKELSKQQQLLKNKENNAKYQAKYREKLKEKLKEAATSSSDIGVRSQAGRPRLEESHEGLLDAIKAAAIYGSASHNRRQTDEIKCCTTIDELHSKVQELLGLSISRSALYIRLIPNNSRTGQASRHVVTVPVRLSKPTNDLHKQHPDGKFCAATIRNLESLASILGPKQCAFLSQDDKARVPIGITAAKEQQSLVMHVDYRVHLPDHDFIVSERHKLIPSVYAGICIKPNGKGDPNDVSYSGPTFIAIRSGKHAQSTAATHAYDIHTLLKETSFSEMLKTDKGHVKPIMIFTVDGGPDENPRFPKNIAFAIQHFQTLNLDAIFVATNAPGRSAFNRVERRMAPLSKQLTGVVLPYDTYGTHLDARGKTSDPDLELRNFEAAGQALANLWSELVIDSYPVTARYEGPDAEAAVPQAVDAVWYSRHVRESQYCLQIVKCNDANYCGELRSDLKMILKNGFLPPLVQFVQDMNTGRLRGLTALENVQGSHFLTLFQAKLFQVTIPTFNENLPYDFACPTVQDDIEPGRRLCKECGLYFASIKAAGSHCRAVHDFRHPKSHTDHSTDINCRRSQRIAAKIAKRGKEVLCRTIHSPTGGEDVEWLDEDEVPTVVPGEVRPAAASDEQPIISDWAAWLANPFSPLDD